jgi:ADP-heptose:LPS heptosyltransferase
VFSHLQIYDPRERWLVGTADALLRIPATLAGMLPRRAPAWPPRRILLLRLERIGDLLMSAPAIAAIRACAPDATIDLVVGSWNASLAALIPGIDSIEVLDAPWLARGATAPSATQAGVAPGAAAAQASTGGTQADAAQAGTGPPPNASIADTAAAAAARTSAARGGHASAAARRGHAELVRRALSWRSRHYDLAINFEGDIRSNGLMMLSGARRRIGFDMAGGGPMLTQRVQFRPDEHTTANAWRLVHEAFGQGIRPADAAFRLAIPAEARERARAMLAQRGDGGGGELRTLIAVHASGGRAIKQWPVSRFAAVAGRLAVERRAVLLLTGTSGDRAMVDEMRAGLPGSVDVIDLVGEVDLPLLAAMLQRAQLLITGDTGPMHLAAFVGTPTVAVFGPSDPVRYAPLATAHRVVRIDLPCAPCNRIRLPPVRCQGHTPDCLEGVTVDAVYAAAADLLAATGVDAGRISTRRDNSSSIIADSITADSISTRGDS